MTLLSGIGVFSGNILARTVGVIVATVSLIANFFFIPAYPLWGAVVITIDLLVIWALTAHGREMRHVWERLSRDAEPTRDRPTNRLVTGEPVELRAGGEARQREVT